jgi:hypothetical protein
VSTWRARVVTVAGIAFGAMWLTAAALKIARPIGAIEMTAHVVPAGVSSKLAVALVVAAETTLGAAMCLRAFRTLLPSLAALLAFSGALLVAWNELGDELVKCGCFGDLLGTTITGALVRNGVLAALHLAVILCCREKRAS